jgi:hypothetical protein
MWRFKSSWASAEGGSRKGEREEGEGEWGEVEKERGGGEGKGKGRIGEIVGRMCEIVVTKD